jgi:hypothetical protein
MKKSETKIISANSLLDAGKVTCQKNYAHMVKIMLKIVKIRPHDLNLSIKNVSQKKTRD